MWTPIFGARRYSPSTSRTTCSAPDSGWAMAQALPPPSPTMTTSGATISSRAAHVAALGGGEEPAGHFLALLAGSVEARLAVVDVMAGPGQDLAAVRLGLAGDAGDLLVVVPEHLVQQEHRPFGRCQALQQHQERHRQGVGHLGPLGRIGFGVGEERLGQPGAHVGLPPHPGGPQVADGQPGGDGGQEGLGRVDAGPVAQCPGQPQEGLLDDVLGVADAPGHPVGDREHQRPELRVIVGRHGFRRHGPAPPFSPSPGSRPASSRTAAPSRVRAWPSR